MDIATGPSLVTGIHNDVGEKGGVKMRQYDLKLDIDITIYTLE